MSLKRKAQLEMELWLKNSPDKALLVTGARQVGKTYLIDQFCKANFQSYIHFDLINQENVLAAFSNAKSSEDLFLAVSAFANQNLIPGETVIFIDEVQECKNAISLIKYLVSNTDYRYILSGSLLGVELADVRSVPVGYVYVVEMFPLDFEEYCWAANLGAAAWDEAAAAFSEGRAVNEAVHSRLLELFHQYLLVGGMPAAVSAFATEKNVQTLHKEQKDILSMYKYDITKYASRNKKLAIREIFDQVPSQLSNQSKRFNFASIAPKGTYERYAEDFLWLIDAGVVILDRNVCEPKRPLKLVEDKSFFKLYMNDVGLLSAACGMDTVRELISNVESVNFGAIYENAVAQELHAHGYDVTFFRNRKMGEVDFVIEREGRVLPVEVKSGKTYNRHSALNNVLKTENFCINHAIVLCEKNTIKKPQVTYFPVYMVAFL